MRRTARRIHAAIRDATPAELTDLAPVQLDLSHPRKVWPEVSELAWDLGTTWATNDHVGVELHRLRP